MIPQCAVTWIKDVLSENLKDFPVDAGWFFYATKGFILTMDNRLNRSSISLDGKQNLLRILETASEALWL